MEFNKSTVSSIQKNIQSVENATIRIPAVIDREFTEPFVKNPLFSKVAPSIESIWQPSHPTPTIRKTLTAILSPISIRYGRENIPINREPMNAAA